MSMALSKLAWLILLVSSFSFFGYMLSDAVYRYLQGGPSHQGWPMLMWVLGFNVGGSTVVFIVWLVKS